MVEREGQLSRRRQCQLLRLNRGAVYYEPVEIGAYELELMSLIDRQYLRTPFYGSRRMTAWLQSQGHAVNRKRVQRLMQRMGLEVIYQRPRTSRPGPGHRIYPTFCADCASNASIRCGRPKITYIPMAQGFLYLVAVMDWVSRYVLAWRLSNLLEASFCIEALEEALGQGRPEIFNTDQGSQFTDHGFTSLLRAHGVAISMDGGAGPPRDQRLLRILQPSTAAPGTRLPRSAAIVRGSGTQSRPRRHPMSFSRHQGIYCVAFRIGRTEVLVVNSRPAAQ